MAKNDYIKGCYNSNADIRNDNNKCLDVVNNINNELDLYTNTRQNDTICVREMDQKSSFSIYRFKFSEEFNIELYNFSKVHQYDDRHEFKNAWNVWKEDNSTVINHETQRLIAIGYRGDVLDKMFKSARYYFRKKCPLKPEPNPRRTYISVNPELLDKMDKHIETNISNISYQPKTGFVTFCEDNEQLINDTISSIFNKGMCNDLDLIKNKIKKTYKNRYFIFTNKK